MNRFNVYVTRAIPEPGLTLLREAPDVELLELNPEDRTLSHRELCSAVQGRDGILSMLTDPIDAEVLRSATRAKVIANYAVGYNNIDVETATELGIKVTNTPGVLTDATADLTWALMLGISRRLVESDNFTRGGHFKSWAPMLFLGGDLRGKTLGIFGAGRIGTAVAKRATGFEMKIIYCSRTHKPEMEALGATQVTLDELLKSSDYLSFHTSLNAATKGLIGPEELKQMKPTAYLINTSRGSVIDEAALADALANRKIAGAALDVYEEEPAIHPNLLELDNVLMTPHTGSATVATRNKMAEMAAHNLLAGLRGEEPPHCVNS